MSVCVYVCTKGRNSLKREEVGDTRIHHHHHSLTVSVVRVEEGRGGKYEGEEVWMEVYKSINRCVCVCVCNTLCMLLFSGL